MGVHFQAEGLAYEDSYDCGYVTFNDYRCELAKAISPLAGTVYAAWLSCERGYEDDDGAFHEDGCRLMLPFPEYDDALEERRLAAKTEGDGESPRPADDAALAALLDGKRDELETIGLLGVELAPGNRGMSALSCTARYEALDRLFSEAFSPEAANLLFAPDTEGSFPWQECRDLYQELREYSMDAVGHNYGESKIVAGPGGKPEASCRAYNMHEQFLNMFKHCWDNRVDLRWG